MPELWEGSLGLRSLPRIAASGVLGLTAGTGVAFVTNRAIYGNPLGGSGSMAAFVQFWGLVVGGITAGLVAGLVLHVRLRPRGRRKAWIIGALILGLLGAGTGYWILWRNVPALTLEGAWLYPVAIFLLLGAGFLMRKAQRLAKSEQDCSGFVSEG